MTRLFATATLVLGSACVTQAQWPAPFVMNPQGNASPERSTTSTVKTTPFDPRFAMDARFSLAEIPASTFAALPVDEPLALTVDAAEPAAPSPKPRFVFGGRDDYRWQLGFGIDWIHFRSSIFNANAVGIRTCVTYFTNSWFGVEGSISAAYAPQIFNKEHVKLLLYGGGPKVALRQKQWGPWLHAIVGGAREQPQTTGNGRNAFGLQIGGGADYRFNPRFSGRLQGDYVLTTFFGQSQNDFQISAGLVLHF